MPHIGTGNQGNAWDGVSPATTGVAGLSAAIDTGGQPFVTAFGSVGGATTITLRISQDNVTFYDTQVNQILAGAADFAVSATLGARFVQLKSSADVKVVATIAAKGS